MVILYSPSTKFDKFICFSYMLELSITLVQTIAPLESVIITSQVPELRVTLK